MRRPYMFKFGFEAFAESEDEANEKKELVAQLVEAAGAMPVESLRKVIEACKAGGGEAEEDDDTFADDLARSTADEDQPTDSDDFADDEDGYRSSAGPGRGMLNGVPDKGPPKWDKLSEDEKESLEKNFGINCERKYREWHAGRTEPRLSKSADGHRSFAERKRRAAIRKFSESPRGRWAAGVFSAFAESFAITSTSKEDFLRDVERMDDAEYAAAKRRWAARRPAKAAAR
jgi:hypothetical protein